MNCKDSSQGFGRIQGDAPGIGTTAANTDLKLAFFQDSPAFVVDDLHHLGCDIKPKDFTLARIQLNVPECLQCIQGHIDRSLDIRDIQLNHFRIPVYGIDVGLIGKDARPVLN